MTSGGDWLSLQGGAVIDLDDCVCVPAGGLVHLVEGTRHHTQGPGSVPPLPACRVKLYGSEAGLPLSFSLSPPHLSFLSVLSNEMEGKKEEVGEGKDKKEKMTA